MTLGPPAKCRRRSGIITITTFKTNLLELNLVGLFITTKL